VRPWYGPYQWPDGCRCFHFFQLVRPPSPWPLRELSLTNWIAMMLPVVPVTLWMRALAPMAWCQGRRPPTATAISLSKFAISLSSLPPTSF
jgi:hypothetical protein